MAIAESGTFDYRIVVQRDTTCIDKWIGQAHSLRDSSRHPGRVGPRPKFELEHDQIVLHSTGMDSHFKYWRGIPVNELSYEVGPAPAMVLQEGDVISFHKEGTGDLALTILRNESLVLALGAVTHLPIGEQIQVKEDPRILYWALMEVPGKTFHQIKNDRVFWIDEDDENLERQINLLNRTRRSGLRIVAMKETVTRDNRSKIWNSVTGDGVWFLEVDEGFRDKNSWLEYMRQLPQERPKDLHISFRTRDQRINLCEGEESTLGDYYIRVDRIYRSGFPGEYSMLAIARLSDGLTREMIIQSAKEIMGWII